MDHCKYPMAFRRFAVLLWLVMTKLLSLPTGVVVLGGISSVHCYTTIPTQTFRHRNFYHPKHTPHRRVFFTTASSPLSLTTTLLRHAASDDIDDHVPDPDTMSMNRITSILLRISYDGRHFTGWSSSNDDFHHRDRSPSPPTDADPSRTQGATTVEEVKAVSNNEIWKRPKRRSRRYRHLPFDYDMTTVGSNSKNHTMTKSYVRSVQGVIQQQLAKLYGNVPISSVVVEGCSRTDKGVHATGMIAQIYCLSGTTVRNTSDVALSASSIPGKRLPYPCNGNDPNPSFKPIPTTLPKLMTSLNRMLYPDIQIMAYAHIPSIPQGSSLPFHPTLSAHRKSYTYTFSIGPMHDPTQSRTVWHIGNHCYTFIDAVRKASHSLVGIHDFRAFSGAPRSKSDLLQRQKSDRYNTTCCIESITITERTDVWTNQNTIFTYSVQIIGDRFLYKMIRFMIGSIIAVGKGQLSMGDLHDMLSTGQRGKEFECAPAHALTLQNVDYNVPIQWQSV